MYHLELVYRGNCLKQDIKMRRKGSSGFPAGSARHEGGCAIIS